MRVLLLLAGLFVFMSSAHASLVMSCSAQQVRIWSPAYGYTCVSQYPSPPNDCVICQSTYLPQRPATNWFETFPQALHQPLPQPWWATQGNLYYPNMNYPGVWAYPGINAQYYPGQGEVFAAKPNIYVESIHAEKKFSLSFPIDKELHFLVTTPLLDDQKSWKGKVKGDLFEMDYVFYDYLFYDIRLPKEKMQFERGLCLNREHTVAWMLKDLKAMKYPPIALQDFEEHWSVKIPKEYPFYCIYPQYNSQLDQALPIKINLDHSHFVRSLYVLVPHKGPPDPDQPQIVPLPLLDSEEIRPNVLIKHENMFKEWGVAFLGK